MVVISSAVKCQHFNELARMTNLISVTILKIQVCHSTSMHPVENLPFLGDPPMVWSPLGAGLSVSMSVCGHIT